MVLRRRGGAGRLNNCQAVGGGHAVKIWKIAPLCCIGTKAHIDGRRQGATWAGQDSRTAAGQTDTDGGRA